MIIGVLKEIKADENRVALSPGGVEFMRQNGHSILVEKNAGKPSGFTNDSYKKAGAEVIKRPESVFEQAEMILRVKEPQPSEYNLLKKGQIYFAYLHLAASEEVTRVMLDSGIISIAYETIQKDNGSLPLLKPMSEVAGRMATQVGAVYLERPYGGRGILMGGVPGVAPANVAVLGGGTVGANAAKIALGMGAHVTVLDVNHDRLQYLDDVFHGRLDTRTSNEYNIEQAVFNADLVIGAVLIPGAHAPRVVSAEQIEAMGISGKDGQGFKRLFMSHPPLEERIAALQNAPG